MPTKTEIIQCVDCEGRSFQIHRTGSAVTFVCTTCGSEPTVRCPVCEVVGGHAASCVAHSADPEAPKRPLITGNHPRRDGATFALHE